MDIKQVLWNLTSVGDCSLLTPGVKEAVKEAARVLAEVHTIMELSAHDDLGRITECVRHCVGAAPGESFAPANIARTVLNLRVQAGRLGSALEWEDSQEAATPMQDEARIIGAALAAINAAYGPNYFDQTGA